MASPGRPVRNGLVESFNRRLRHECLNEHLFAGPKEARRTIQERRSTTTTISGRLPERNLSTKTAQGRGSLSQGLLGQAQCQWGNARINGYMVVPNIAAGATKMGNSAFYRITL